MVTQMQASGVLEAKVSGVPHARRRSRVAMLEEAKKAGSPIVYSTLSPCMA